MTLLFIRIFFIILSTVVGFFTGTSFVSPHIRWGIIGAVLGLFISAGLIVFESWMRKVSIRNLSAAVFGLIFGLFMSWVLTSTIKLIPMDIGVFSTIQIILTLIFCYLGMIIAIRGKDEFNLVIPYVKFTRQDQKNSYG